MCGEERILLTMPDGQAYSLPQKSDPKWNRITTLRRKNLISLLYIIAISIWELMKACTGHQKFAILIPEFIFIEFLLRTTAVIILHYL